MKILIIGSGGREHALAWKCAQSDRVDEVLVAPGNAGTGLEEGVRNVAVGAEDIDGLLDVAAAESVDLTIVGPEVPLVAGIVDRFRDQGLACFGPDAAGAQLEGSKAFAKDFLAKYNIPTAAYRNFEKLEPALAYIRAQGTPIVIKADGLAAGKGVIVAQTLAEAEAAATDMLSGNRFGEAGHRIVVEEFLQGEEASFIVITDGSAVLPLASSQDHKARDEGDTGPNTGGMGAYSPAPVITEPLMDQITREVLVPTVDGMNRNGTPYKGVLYAGIMVTAGGPRVLEFNVRFGDPETQPILMRLKSDLLEVMLAVCDGTLDEITLEWDKRPAVCVVMASGGYPDDYEKGKKITGLEEAGRLEDVFVFHAGTKDEHGDIVTAGGRVLGVTALGETIAEAKARAYQAVDTIAFDGAYCRRDIADKAIK